VVTDIDIKEAAPQRHTVSPAEVHVRSQLQAPIMPQTVPDFTNAQAVPLTLDVQTGGMIEVDGVVAVGEVSMIDEVPKNRPHAMVLQAPVAAEHAPKVVQQLAVTMVQHKDQLTEIALDPPELGKVKMQLSITDGVAQVVLAVERPETNDLIRRHLDQLANELGALGYRDITFEFSDSNFGGQHPGNGDAATNDDPDIVETPQPKTIAVTSGLDIRL
jgi:flagellar hook-length control protein FliK